MSTPQAVCAAIAASVSALTLLLGAGTASAATDHVVITGGAVVPAGRTAGDIVVLDGTVRIAGHAKGDVVSVSGPVRLTGRVDGDLIAVSDRAFLGPAARVGGDLRYGDERPVLAPGSSVGGKISKEDWADATNGWGWVGVFGWWLAVSVSTLIVGALLYGWRRAHSTARSGRCASTSAPPSDGALRSRSACRCWRSWRSSRSWASRSASHCCWPRSPCCSSRT